MKQSNVLINLFFFLAFCVLFVYILIIWADLIRPFIIALLFSFATIGLSNFYQKLKIPYFLSLIFSIFTYIFLFWGIWKIINLNLDDVIRTMPTYQKKIQDLYVSFLDYFGVSRTLDFYSVFSKIDLGSIFKNVIWSVASLFSNAWLIFFYVMFILLEYRFFWRKLNLILEKNSKKSQVFEIIEKIKKDIRSYFLIKTFVSLLTGILSYLVMTLFWLNFALFWAMIIFFLNFIPTIWSVIAVSFPVLLSLVQYDSYYPFLFITIWLVWVQILMWNIIEPKFMWNKLNLSPLVIILSLWFWWSIWGIVGMILSVPLMIILNIILSKIPQTRFIAIIFSEKWILDIDKKFKIKK